MLCQMIDLFSNQPCTKWDNMEAVQYSDINPNGMIRGAFESHIPGCIDSTLKKRQHFWNTRGGLSPGGQNDVDHEMQLLQSLAPLVQTSFSSALNLKSFSVVAYACYFSQRRLPNDCSVTICSCSLDMFPVLISHCQFI